MKSPLIPALLALAGLFSPVLAAAGECERLVATGDPEQPPYLWLDPQQSGRLVGASADLLEQLGKALDVRIDLVRSATRARAEENVASGRVDLLLGSFPSAERRASMDFIQPALFVRSVSVWGRKGRDFPYGGWSDLYGQRGVTLAGNRLAGGFEPLTSGYLPLEEVATLSEGLERLRRGEAAYLLGERQAVEAAAEDLGMLADIQPLGPPLVTQGLYLAMGHDSACNEPELRARLAAKLAELSAAGVPQDLLQRSVERWKAQRRPSSSSASAAR